MAVRSGMFNSVRDGQGIGDRRYEASFFASYFSSFIGNGVFPIPSNGLQVMEKENMKTVVNAGKGWINGYYLINDSDYVIEHDVSDGVLKRIDSVILRLNFLSRNIEISLLKGEYSNNPVPKALTRNTDYYELSLANVLIDKGALKIIQSNITDNRLNKDLCGIVHGVVDQVDATSIFNQYQSWFEQQKTEYEDNFNSWSSDKEQEFEDWQDSKEAEVQQFIDELNSLLDGDVAANLVNEIEKVKTDVADLTETVNDKADLIDGKVPLDQLPEISSGEWKKISEFKLTSQVTEIEFSNLGLEKFSKLKILGNMDVANLTTTRNLFIKINDYAGATYDTANVNGVALVNPSANKSYFDVYRPYSNQYVSGDIEFTLSSSSGKVMLDGKMLAASVSDSGTSTADLKFTNFIGVVKVTNQNVKKVSIIIDTADPNNRFAVGTKLSIWGSN